MPAERVTAPAAAAPHRLCFSRLVRSGGLPESALFACVLAKSDGTILAVRRAQPIHGGAADRELVAAIRDGWRFQGTGGAGAGWERVRLNQGGPLDALLFN